MMLCLLVAAVLALQQRRETLGGVLAGLAVMTRTTALIPLIALGVLLLFGGQWRALVKLAGAAAVVVAVVMAPFFLVDRADTLYSFLTWRGTAPIGGNSIWSIFAAPQRHRPPPYTGRSRAAAGYAYRHPLRSRSGVSGDAQPFASPLTAAKPGPC